jgi:rubrerythrin
MDRNEIINGCIKVESVAASIYSKLMQIFPEEQDFWEGLYNDEKKHISFLHDVKSLGLCDDVWKMNLLPSKPMIRDALQQAEKINKKISNGPVTFKEALRITLALEESMVETYTNKLIASLLCCDNEASFNDFVTNEKDHKNKIKSRIRKAR